MSTMPLIALLIRYPRVMIANSIWVIPLLLWLYAFNFVRRIYGCCYYCFLSEGRDTRRINKLPKNSSQVYRTNKPYLHVLIPSFLNNILCYEDPSSPWTSQEARNSHLRKPLGFLSWQCSRLDVDCFNSESVFLLKLKVRINTTLRTLGCVLFFIIFSLIFLPPVFRMLNILMLTPLRAHVNPN